MIFDRAMPPFAGATLTTAGLRGAVPGPAIADRTKFLRGDGSWQTIAGGGDLLAANNLGDLTDKPEAHDALGAGEINVKLYGYVGDGVADDTVALQAALDSTNRRLFVPVTSGFGFITTALTIPSNKRLRLADGATLKRMAAIDNMLRNDGDGVAGVYTANSSIEVCGGTWDANSGSYATACTTLAFGHCSNVLIRDTEIKDTPVWHSIEINASQLIVIDNVRFNGCPANEALQFDTAKSGVGGGIFPWFGPYDDTKCKDAWVTRCVFNTCATGVGSHSDPAIDNLYVGQCVFNGTTAAAIKPNGYTDLTVDNCLFAACHTVFQHTAAQGGVTRLKFVKNTLTSSTTVNIDLEGVTNASIVDNIVTTATTARSWIVNAGTTVAQSGNVVDGVLILATATAEALAAKALYCDGTAVKVDFASPTAIGTGDFWLCGWYKPVEIRANTYLVSATTANSAGLRINADGSITLRKISAADILSSPAGSVVANAWHFIEVWRGGGTLYIAVDGYVRASVADATDFSATTTALSTATATGAYGLLARVALHNFAPTTAERLRAYHTLGLLPYEWRGGSLVAVTGGAFTVGRRYKIETVGTTDYTAIGASANTVGVTFTATGAGTGTGTALPAGALWALNDADRGSTSTVADISGNSRDFALPATGITRAMPLAT